VTIEVVLLALATTIRPTSLAAIYALVAGEAPRRLMTAYVASGLAFTVGFGLLVIWAFHGIVNDTGGGDDPVRGIAQVGAGAVAVVFAALVQARVIGRSRPDDAPTAPGHRDRLRGTRLTLRTAALAGPATHIPGLFYLLALNVIITHRPSVAVGFIEVAIYNLVWFMLPIAALVVCIVRPPLARDVVSAIEEWAKANARPIIVIGSLVVGVLLVVRGALSL
jgi:hypothetical protein